MHAGKTKCGVNLTSTVTMSSWASREELCLKTEKSRGVSGFKGDNVELQNVQFPVHFCKQNKTFLRQKGPPNRRFGTPKCTVPATESEVWSSEFRGVSGFKATVWNSKMYSSSHQIGTLNFFLCVFFFFTKKNKVQVFLGVVQASKSAVWHSNMLSSHFRIGGLEFPIFFGGYGTPKCTVPVNFLLNSKFGNIGSSVGLTLSRLSPIFLLSPRKFWIYSLGQKGTSGLQFARKKSAVWKTSEPKATSPCNRQRTCEKSAARKA